METTQTRFVSERGREALSRRLTWRERLFVRLLGPLQGGSLRIEFPNGGSALVGDASCPLVELRIRDTAFFRRVLGGGAVGFGEAYVEGLWSTPALPALLGLLARNQRDLGRLQRGFSLLAHQANRLYHRARRNTVAGSRENIREHYDLSNEFYKTFLDGTMSYSSACFAHEGESLESAQVRKIDRMLDLAGAKAGDHILEIGSGWGALALRAARRGCRVTTITLSSQQHAYCLDLFEREGVADRIEVALRDYRELKGRFDAVVSCEMIEAVGREYLPGYFETIGRSLKPGAKAVLQAITIPDERYESYCRSCDWIQKHIFPGGHLPSPGAIRGHAGASGNLTVVRMDAFGGDYARTLRRWRAAFGAAEARVDGLGFGECFRRKWDYYFSYCIAGFEEGLIDVRHVVLEAG